MRLFHLVGEQEWKAATAAGSYAPASLDREGFIHFSTDRQLMTTAERFYAWPLRRGPAGRFAMPAALAC